MRAIVRIAVTLFCAVAVLIAIPDGAFTDDSQRLPAPYAAHNTGSSGVLITPNAIAIDKSVMPNRVYVSDGASNRVLGWNDANGLIDGHSPDLVIGQPDFASRGCNDGTASGDVSGVGADSLCGPYGVGVDSHGNLYVADSLNNRVLEYHAPFAGCASFPCVGPTANLVIGQSSFTGADCARPPALSAKGLCVPDGIAIDSDDNLYVADASNCRVLEYNSPLADGSTPNITANLVFGQGTTGRGIEFTTAACGDGLGGDSNPSANSLAMPAGLSLDSADNLYVADYGACRVLEYIQPLGDSGSPNVTADAVWGHAGDFSVACSGANGAAATNLSLPADARVDVQGNLYVADSLNNRVLRYDASPVDDSTQNAIANAVYGQGAAGTNFTSSASGTEQGGLNLPSGVGFDSSGGVLVADQNNGRVVQFAAPAASSTHAGTVNAPAPIHVTAAPDQTVNAGSFKYTNKTNADQQISSVTITVTNPLALLSLTINYENGSSTISPVTPNTTIQIVPPLTVGKGKTTKFKLQAQTIPVLSSKADGGIAYAAMIASSHFPLGPMGGAMMLLGVILIPLGIGRQRRVVLMACAAVALMAAIAGCGSLSSTVPPTGVTRSVDNTGTLSSPARLSTINVKNGGTTISTVQSVSALGLVQG